MPPRLKAADVAVGRVEVQEVLAVLQSGEFEPLIGVSEGGQLDFKRQPYDLASESAKFELAKDAVAFANADVEALIVVGIEAARDEDSPFEHARRLRLVPRTQVDEKQYLAVIRSRCYPALRGVAATLHPSKDDESRCLLTVHIPRQQEADRPFLVLSPLAPEGKKVQGWLVGLPTRSLDETEHMGPGELHEVMVRGRSVASRLDEIVGLLGRAPSIADETNEPRKKEHRPRSSSEAPSQPATPTSPPDIIQRAERALDSLAFEDDGQGGRVGHPALFLASVPSTRSAIPTIFNESGVRQVVQNPPASRADGWNLATMSRAEIVEGSRLSLLSARRKLVELYEDALLIAVGRFDRLLGIPPNPYGANQAFQKVNCLALIEFIHDFVLVTRALQQWIDPTPAAVRFEIGVRYAKGAALTLYLPPYGLGSWGFEAPFEHEAPDSSSFTWGVDVPASKLEPGPVAFELVKRVYAFFKRTVEEIPYLGPDRNAVDPETFGRRPS